MEGYEIFCLDYILLLGGKVCLGLYGFLFLSGGLKILVFGCFLLLDIGLGDIRLSIRRGDMCKKRGLFVF